MRNPTPIAAAIAIAIAASSSSAQESTGRSPWPAESDEQAEILVLGSFHFADRGLDSYRPRFDIDVRSPERQAEIEELVAQLAAFRPTKIAVEARSERQAHLDSLYRAYRAGEHELGAEELYQVGFRLAARLGHERVWAVDAPGRRFEPNMTQAEWDSAVASRPAIDTTWDAHYFRWYAWEDSLKTTMPLVDYFLYVNEPERLMRSHGHYLVGGFERSGGAGDYFGVDAMTWWWNRNLRIFRNLQRLRVRPDERILLLIGSGHAPLIRHAIEASPEYRLVEVAEYLRPLE